MKEVGRGCARPPLDAGMRLCLDISGEPWSRYSLILQKMRMESTFPKSLGRAKFPNLNSSHVAHRAGEAGEAPGSSRLDENREQHWVPETQQRAHWQKLSLLFSASHFRLPHVFSLLLN